PDSLGRVARHHRAPARGFLQRPREALAYADNGVAQGAVARALALMPDEVFLAEPLDPDDGVIAHQMRSAKVFSVRRNMRTPSPMKTATTTRLSAKPGR